MALLRNTNVGSINRNKAVISTSTIFTILKKNLENRHSSEILKSKTDGSRGVAARNSPLSTPQQQWHK
jgi:hypothetical protein